MKNAPWENYSHFLSVYLHIYRSRRKETGRASLQGRRNHSAIHSYHLVNAQTSDNQCIYSEAFYFHEEQLTLEIHNDVTIQYPIFQLSLREMFLDIPSDK